MTSKHTPGPWAFIDNPVYNCFSVDSDDGAIGIADVSRQPIKNQGLANARLIAASPKLLKALENAVKELDHMADIFSYRNGAVLRDARAAINEAKGVKQ